MATQRDSSPSDHKSGGDVTAGSVPSEPLTVLNEQIQGRVVQNEVIVTENITDHHADNLTQSSSESMLISCHAAIYGGTNGVWEVLEGLANVWLMQDTHTKAARVVASNEKMEFVLNTLLHPALQTTAPSPSFLHWADENGAIIALNFADAETLNGFNAALNSAVLQLSESAQDTAPPLLIPPQSPPPPEDAPPPPSDALALPPPTDAPAPPPPADAPPPPVTSTVGNASVVSHTRSLSSQDKKKKKTKSSKHKSSASSSDKTRKKSESTDSSEVPPTAADSLLPMRAEMTEGDSSSSVAQAEEENRRQAVEDAKRAALEEAKRIRLRESYAREIATTEGTYVSSLQCCVQIWMRPMQDKKLLTEDERKELFSNMEVILDFNQKLQAELESRMKNWDTEETKIGDVFVSLAPYLRLYKQYCDNYDNALNVLERLSKKKEFRKHLKRIPRYNLLLRDLIRQTLPHHPDYANIQEALKHIGTVADDINKSVLKAEKARAMADLMKRGFTGLDSLMAPHRHLLLDGPLFASFNSIECSWVLLFNDIVAFASPIDRKDKAKEGKAIKRQIQGYLEFNYTWALSVPEVGDDAIELKTPEQQVLLRTKQNTEDPQGAKKKEKDKEREKDKEFDGRTSVNTNWLNEIQQAIKHWLLRPLTPAEKEFEVNHDLIKDDECSNRYAEFKFRDGTSYKGLWSKGKYSGHGRLVSPNNSMFEGTFQRGGLQGAATAHWSDGSRYEGEWQLDLPHGMGTLILPDGTRYTGQWAVGRRKGQGKIEWANGDSYDGEWNADRFHGTGTLTRKGSSAAVDASRPPVDLPPPPPPSISSSSQAVPPPSDIPPPPPSDIPASPPPVALSSGPQFVYSGGFKDGLRHGQGKLVSRTFEYDGMWDHDLRHGKGVERDAEGTYDGDFERDRRHGHGQWRSANGQSGYIGEWRSNRFHGTGTFTNTVTNYKFTGEYLFGLKHGYGEETCGDGSSYIGTFEDDLFEGRGTQTTHTGEKYKGHFHMGMRYGDGTVTYANGDSYQGDWFRNRREGHGVYTFACGASYEGEWEEDLPNGFGQLEYAEGVVHEGVFFQGRRQGAGTLSTPEGLYAGTWKNEIMEGPATFRESRTRSVFDGDMKDGRRNGKGTLTLAGDKKEIVTVIYAFQEGVQKNPGLKYFPPSLGDPPHLNWLKKF